MMLKAVIQNGTIVPKEPLPGDWSDGTEVQVEAIGSNGPESMTPEEMNQSFDRLGELCSLDSCTIADNEEISPETAARLAREAEEWVRDVKAAAAKIPPEEADALMAALAEIKRESKEHMRREMGLP